MHYGNAGREFRVLPWWCMALIGRRPKRTLVRIGVLVTVCFVLFRFVLAPIRIEGPSMLPTYRKGQVHMINRLAYRFHEPRRGDVVAIKYAGEHVMLLKRIVGLPGETVAFQGGRLLINGQMVEEPYVRYSCDWEMPPVAVGRRRVLCCWRQPFDASGVPRSGPVKAREDLRQALVMKSRLFSLVGVAAIAAAGLWGWRAWFPSPEKAIRQRLGELARTASFGRNEGALARMLNCDKLAGFFADDAEVKLELGNHVEKLSGREKLRDAAMSARLAFASLKVDFHDMNIVVGADRQSAEVDLTAVGKVPGEQDPQVCELKFLLKRIGGDWMIRRVETVKTLR